MNETRPLTPGWISQKQQNIYGKIGKLVQVDSVAGLSALLEKETGIVTVFVSGDGASQLYSLKVNPECNLIVHCAVNAGSFPLGEIALAGNSQVLLSKTSAEVQRHAVLGYFLCSKSPVFHYYQEPYPASPQSVLDIDYSVFKTALLESKEKSLQEIYSFLSSQNIHFNPIQYLGQSSEDVLVSFGSVSNIAESLSQQKFGLVQIFQPVPWNKISFIKSLPSHVKNIHLLLPPGSEWSPQYLDIVSTLSSSNIDPSVSFVTESSPFYSMLPRNLEIVDSKKIVIDPSVNALLSSVFRQKLKIQILKKMQMKF